jgi:hypothetical protein
VIELTANDERGLAFIRTSVRTRLTLALLREERGATS